MGIRADRVATYGRSAFLASAAIVLAGCDRFDALDPPTRIQLNCVSTSMSTSSSASAVTPMILVLDTGSRDVEWVNGAGTPTGSLAVADEAYTVRFGPDGPAGWRAEINRFDGRMTRRAGPDGPRQAQETFRCTREAEGPRL